MVAYDPNQYASTTNQNQQGNQTTASSGTSKSTSTQSGTQAGTGTQQNTYLPFQSQIQGGLGSDVNSFLTTGVAPNTQNVLNVENEAWKQNFDQRVAPQLAAQYGAGSPAIGSALAQGLLQNEANVFSTQAQAYNSELGTAGNLALTPSGSNTAQQQNQQSTGTTKGSWQGVENQTDLLANQAQSLGNSWSY